MRRSVIIDMSESIESPGRHVTTSPDIQDDTARPKAASPSWAMARTTSRSDTMPSIDTPSALTTSAPTPWSRSAAIVSDSDPVGRMVATAVPLAERMDWTFIVVPLTQICARRHRR